MAHRLRLRLLSLTLFLAAPALASAQPPDGVTLPAPATAPFPDGASYAYVDVQRVLLGSRLGQAASVELVALRDLRAGEIDLRQQAIRASQQRLEAGLEAMSPQAITQVRRDIERQQLALQRFTQDAEQELTRLQTERVADIERRLQPLIEQVFVERRLLMLFDAGAAPLLLAHPALDLTAELIERLDQATPES